MIVVWGGGESGFKCWGSRNRARVILVLRECNWSAPAVSLVLPAFDVTGSLSFPACLVVYPLGSTLDAISVRGIGKLS